MKNIEIEVKLKIDEPEKLLNWLGKNAQLIKTCDQTDYYFDPPHKTYIRKDAEGYQDAEEWFRIRISEKGDEICYKFWHRDPTTGKSIYADEIETSIGDHKQVLAILSRLGFKETSMIKKHRESYRYGNFQFDCDTVEDLGFFVEVEFKGKIEHPEKGKEIIFEFLRSINLTKWKKTKRGYSWIQWNPERNHFEEP